MELLQLTWPNNLTQFVGYLFTWASGTWILWTGIMELSKIRFQRLRDIRERELAVVDKEIQIAKSKQFSLEQIAELLQKVHKVEDEMENLNEAVNNIQQSEKEHKADVKERLHEMKESLKELNTNIYNLLTKDYNKSK